MANLKPLMSSNRQDWETPDSLFRALNAEFHFTLDVCATAENTKCERFFSPENNGLIQGWDDEVCWLNPPYGRSSGDWLKRALRETMLHETVVVALIPARTDTELWHRFVMDCASQVRFMRGRPWFSSDGKQASSRAPFPCAIVIYQPHYFHTHRFISWPASPPEPTTLDWR